MARDKISKVELTNMCMIVDNKKQKPLVEERTRNDWPGLTFPGGHVETGESVLESVVREIKEETGLTVSNLILCGIREWPSFEPGVRYLSFLYKTSDFRGNLKSSDEGKVKWLSISEIKAGPMAMDFPELLEEFLASPGGNYYFNKPNYTLDSKVKEIADLELKKSIYLSLNLDSGINVAASSLFVYQENNTYLAYLVLSQSSKVALEIKLCQALSETLAKTLIKAAINYAISNNYSYIITSVEANQLDLIALYETLGFKVIKTTATIVELILSF